MQLIYKGAKNPKVVLDGEEEVRFIPGEAQKVSATLGETLLSNAPDIFKKVGAKKEEDEDITPSPGEEPLGEPEPEPEVPAKKEKKKPGPKPGGKKKKE